MRKECGAVFIFLIKLLLVRELQGSCWIERDGARLILVTIKKAPK